MVFVARSQEDMMFYKFTASLPLNVQVPKNPQ